MANQQLPSLKFTFFLGALLILPYLVKLLYSEPYPAVILPSGHTKLSVQDSIYCAPSRVLLAIDANTLEYRTVPADSFLSPAPVRLLAYWEINEFGMAAIDGNIKTPSPSEINEVKRWYKMKLNSLGFQTAKFKMVRMEKCYDRNTRALLSEDILKETTYELD